MRRQANEAPGPRGPHAGAVLLLAACVSCVGVSILGQMLPGAVEEQSLALGGAPDQSRTSVVGDATIDSSWKGVWKRTPAAYRAVSRELAGYQDLSGAANTVPADTAVAKGESILSGYSTVLGARKVTVRPAVDLVKRQKKRLYDAFILRGGRKAQLFDAATHDRELKKYSGVLSFSDKLPAHAVDGPAGTAIKSSTDELNGYSSILDFATRMPVLKKKSAPVRSHQSVLSFVGSEQDAKMIKQREADHHVLQPEAMVAEHDSHKNILSFPDDERDSHDIAQREAGHKVLDTASLTAERRSHDGILRFNEQGAAAMSQKVHATLEPKVVSKELTSYDSILEFPGQRQLSNLKDPSHSGSELKAYNGILDFAGHAASSAHTRVSGSKAHTLQHSHSHTPPVHAATTSTSVHKLQSGSKGVLMKGVVGKGALGSKRGQRTMLLDEALVQQTVQQVKAIQEQPILIEPPAEQDSSPIAKKLAHLYQEATELITEETTAKPPAGSTPTQAAAAHHDMSTDMTLRAAAPQRPAHARERAAQHEWRAEERRQVARDPVLNRLRRQAAQLRGRLHKVHEEKKQQALEEGAMSHVEAHEEKMLKLDEGIEHKMTHKTKRGIKRADYSMAHMIKDDEAKLYKLEVQQEHRNIAQARRHARVSGMQRLSMVEQKHLTLEHDHALLLAKIHQLSKNLPQSYHDGVVSGEASAHADLQVLSADDSEKLVQLDDTSVRASVLSSRGKVEYASKLAHAEQLLAQARTLSQNIVAKSKHSRSDQADVAKLDTDLEGIANVLKDRALHVVLDGKIADESLHMQQLHTLMDAAVAHADIVLGKGGRASGLEQVLHQLRNGVEEHATTHHVRNNPREQVLRSLLAEEKHRKSKLRQAMTSLHKHVRSRNTLMQATEAALERSGDYVQPLHAPAVLLPRRHAHARDGVRAERKDEAEWQKDLKMASSPDLLSDSSDSTNVLSLEGTADENKALKTDISALVDATQHSDVKQYDGMLKAAIKKSEKKLSAFEAAQGSESSEVLGDLAHADHVFASTRTSSPENAVHVAMQSAKRIEKQLHLKFDHKGSIYQLVKPARKALKKHGKHYIAGLGIVDKDNGLISQLWKHHRVPLAQVEALEVPKLHTLSKRTHARLTDHGVFKAQGVLRRMTAAEPSAWGIVHTDADTALADGTDVGKDVAEATGWALKGLTSRADTRKASGDAKANSLWHYV